MYDWIKALHVLAVISWMAGLLYLPRLFVYHCAAPVGTGQSETFKIMERRLLKAIMTPAMIVAWLSGLYLAWVAGFWSSPWFLVKFAAVIAMSGAHGFLASCVRLFAADRNTRDHRFYRVVNEVPTALMVLVVIMVIVKPW
jgi:putative membrane protein